MTIEREIELASGKGVPVKWQAYGLDQIELQVPPTVYPPREDTVLMDRAIAELGKGGGRSLLEIGCGSGAVSISATLRGWKVSACDVNPLAIAATRGNAASLGLHLNTEVREGGPGDISHWQPDHGVDVIAWNLPYLEPQQGGHLGPMEDSALIGGGEGGQLLNALTERPALLNQGGIILMLHSSNEIGYQLGRNWRNAGWATRNVSQTAIGDERLTVVACWRPFETAEIHRLKSCESTNDELRKLRTKVQGTFVSTQEQVSGRGYAGREWFNSPGGFMGSWLLSEKSIERGPEVVQLAATVAILDAFSTLLNHGLPSHSWIHGSNLEGCGFRVKWPNDIWLRTPTQLGKLCGVIVEGRTQGDEARIILGIGINRTSVPQFSDSIGWDQISPGAFEDISPIIHASIASALEVHPMVPSVLGEDVLNSIYATMRCTLSEGTPRAFGVDRTGGLRTHVGIIRSTDDIEWKWH